jgi:excisionase family DNA binding protein
MPEAEYFTKTEAAEYVRLSRATIDRLRQSGDLRYVKVGGRIVFRKRDLDAFMAARVVKK